MFTRLLGRIPTYSGLTALLQRMSLKTKLIVIAVSLVVMVVWVLAVFSATILKHQFEQVLVDQQFAATQRLALDLDNKLAERINSLEQVAGKLPAVLNAESLDPYLAQLGALHVSFSAGIAVIGLDGKAVADYPVVPGRRGTYFGDRDYFRQIVTTQQPYIDKPIMGRALRRPVLTIGVPVFDRNGSVRAVMTGITDLSAPNFLGLISGSSMAGKGEIFIISPRDHIILSATDSSRILSPAQARGRSAMYDRFIGGFEGSGLGTDAEGVSKLYSGKRVPASGWLVISSLPEDVIFAPLKNLQGYLFAAAALLTLLAALLIRWIADRMLAPLVDASAAMRHMTEGQIPLKSLPVARNDEVGQLIGNFNLLIEDRHRYETALAESEQRLRSLVESAPDAIFVQTHGRFVYANAAALRLFGATTKEELIDKVLTELVHPDFRAAAEERIRRLDEEKISIPQQEARYLRLDNSTVDVEVSAVPFKFGNENGGLHFVRDITERKYAEQTQEKLNRALRLLSECNVTLVHAEDEQSLLDEICRLLVVNGGYLMAWVGFAQDDAERTVRPVSQFGLEKDYLQSARISWADTERGRGTTGTAIRTGKIQVNQDFLGNPAMAPWRNAALKHGYQSSIALPLTAEGKAFGALNIYSADPGSFAEDEVQLLQELANDLAFGIATLRTRLQREAAEEKLAFLAYHDPLTHLPNRVLLRDRFDRAVSSAQREQSGVAMLVLDLDNFKRINDGLGREIGDQFLLRVVERLQACIRDSDTVSRQSGDEFVVLLNNVKDSASASRVAQLILDTISEPFEINGHTFTTSFSIGISLYPNDGHDFDTLMKHADAALYHAKDNGRDTYHFFAGTMNVDALARMQLHGNLRQAVKNQEFLLHYQPQIDIASGAITGAEALVRWQRPGEGLIAPGRFIPLAEETGMIVQIGEWVLNEACRQAKAWMDAGMKPLVIAVNLSGQQFKRGEIVDTVARALDRSGLPSHLLELELTESILLQDTEMVMETLHRLKKLGVQLSIDDFGTGYSSLSYLKRLSVDKLKVDQSFVRDLGHDKDNAAIVQAVIQLGQALQLCVIAEGVETQEQFDFLRDYGCNQVQGYLISRPLPALDFAEFSSSVA